MPSRKCAHCGLQGESVHETSVKMVHTDCQTKEANARRVGPRWGIVVSLCDECWGVVALAIDGAVKGEDK